jgi:hypothetical protein
MTNTTLLSIAIALGIVSLGLAIVNLWQTRSLNQLKNTFFSGGKAGSFEELLHSIARHIQILEKDQSEALTKIQSLEHTITFAIQKIGVVRFNPFDDGGGNFSFSVALLDGHNSGLVITSMHGREQNRIYTKRIDNGKSESQLTAEETQAVQAANKI